MTPTAPFVRFATLWIQLTGTRCNLACVHCLNASSPGEPWLPAMTAGAIARHIGDAERLGVKEIYLTGGEPFLHPDIMAIVGTALAVAPTTVLTNGTLISEPRADALAALAAAARYSLEIRVSLDEADEASNDRVRGRDAFDKAVTALRRLHARGLLPILTATEIGGGGPGAYERFRALLLSLGIDKPRVKILPVFRLGRLARDGDPPLTEAMLDGFDRSVLQCADSRVVASGGVYACPILAGLDVARLSTDRLEDSFGPAPLSHPACVTCYETGMTCRN
ncbi:MAG: radical SAM protein [Candidatus Rokuibacteriota bacterium]